MRLSLSSLKSKEYKEQKELDEAWAVTIKAKDSWRCAICGSDYHPNAHHIIPREHKQYRHALDNGITLCTKHHKFSRIISAHNNPLGFFVWLMSYRSKLYAIAFERQRKIIVEEGIDVGLQY